MSCAVELLFVVAVVVVMDVVVVQLWEVVYIVKLIINFNDMRKKIQICSSN